MDDAVRLAQPLSAIDSIREDFASLDDWEDRYRYVIELGNALEPLSKEAHNDLTKVRGCVSQVWLDCESRTNAEGGRILHYRGDSDSHLVRGLIAIAIALFSDRTPDADPCRGCRRRLSRARSRATSDAPTLEWGARHGRSDSDGRGEAEARRRLAARLRHFPP